jgi:meso-butanediol dehydrogenase/(S,S)-butanediol dehydrogenase/diacetyl reductase
MLEPGVTGRFLNVTRPSEVTELITWIEDTLGPITVLVNNAGIIRICQLLKLTEKELREVFEVNFFGTFFCTQVVAPKMVERRRGRIVNIASIAGKGGRPNFASYAASKAAVLNLTQSYALALAPYSITVNAVCPGIVCTGMWEQLDSALSALEGVPRGESLARRTAQIPLQRLESVDDVANFVSYLVSPMGAYITGQGINVDGGLEFH